MPKLDRCFYVYVLFRPWDGSPFYVGKGKGKRWLDHERPSENHPNRHLVNVVKKAKRLGLEIPKVKVRESMTEVQAFKIEIALIAAIGREANGGPLVNLTDGGDGTSGWTHSPEWRAKMSQIMTGKPGPLKGKKHSTETIEKLRVNANRSERIALSSEQGRKTKGSKRTPEQRATLSAAHTGKVLSASHCANIGKGNTGGKRSEATRERMSIAQQKIADQMSEIVRERWKDPEYREKTIASMSLAAIGNKHALGVVHTTESRANMSEGQRRRAPPNKKTRAKMSATCKANWEKPEYRAIMLAARVAARIKKADKQRLQKQVQLEMNLKIVGEPEPVD